LIAQENFEYYRNVTDILHKFTAEKSVKSGQRV